MIMLKIFVDNAGGGVDIILPWNGDEQTLNNEKVEVPYGFGECVLR